MPRPGIRNLRGLLSRLPGRLRPAVIGVAALSAIERVSVVVVAATFEGETRAIAAWGSASLGAVFAIRALARSALLRRARVALADAAVASLLEREPLDAPPDEDLHATIFEGLHSGTQLIAGDLPSFLGGVAAFVPVCVIVARVLASPLVALGAIALAAAMVAVVAARPTVARLAEEQRASWQVVIEDVATAIDGRIEVVASGLAADYLSGVRDRLARWTVTARNTGLRSGVLSRAPAVAGGGVIAIAVLADANLYHEIGSSPWATALVAASALPTVLGLAKDAIELVRSEVRLRPFVAFLAHARETRRPERGLPPPALPALIEWRRVSFAYGDARARHDHPVLEDVSIEWHPGEILTLEGPNGSGKSTLLRLLMALGRPTSGSIAIGAVDLQTLDVAAFRQRIAYLPQRPYLNERASARAAIRLLAPEASEATMKHALERVELWSALAAHAQQGDPLETRVGSLSAGERQRLALARLLCRPAPIVLLDEPDANVDARGLVLIERVVRDLSRERMVAIAAHAPELLRLGDTRLRLQCEEHGSRRAG